MKFTRNGIVFRVISQVDGVVVGMICLVICCGHGAQPAHAEPCLTRYSSPLVEAAESMPVLLDLQGDHDTYDRPNGRSIF